MVNAQSSRRATYRNYQASCNLCLKLVLYNFSHTLLSKANHKASANSKRTSQLDRSCYKITLKTMSKYVNVGRSEGLQQICNPPQGCQRETAYSFTHYCCHSNQMLNCDCSRAFFSTCISSYTSNLDNLCNYDITTSHRFLWSFSSNKGSYFNNPQILQKLSPRTTRVHILRLRLGEGRGK